jgi:hypothetical protein
MIFAWVYFFLCLFLWSGFAEAETLTAARQKALHDALEKIDVREYELGFDKLWVEDDTFRLSLIDTLMDNPLTIPDYGDRFVESLPDSNGDFTHFLKARAHDLDCDIAPEIADSIDRVLASAPPVEMSPFGLALTTFRLASGFLDEAFVSLTPDERRVILVGAPIFWADEDDKLDDTLKGALHRAWGQVVDTTVRADNDTLLSLAAKVNRQALMAATYAFWTGLVKVTDEWLSAKAPFSATQVDGVEGLVLAKEETPYGLFVLGGRGANVYRRRFAFVLDLGGNDQYPARTGVGIGGLVDALSATIDLGGDDAYGRGDLADQGVGILGLGALIDLGGSDTYRAGFLSQGCGFFGSGLLVDGEGNDTYTAQMSVQGAGTVGLGLLLDLKGRDIYDAYGCAQGFAGTFGSGTLADLEGNDVYRAGGYYIHHPLRPQDYRSLSQGFSIGWRPRAGGGVGVLYDRTGNDFYDAEIYAQGTSYWYSLGMLIDESGQDSYNATQYSQGAGIHLSVGYLYDGSGDDGYRSHFGPGQGSAHDLAVGMLIDGSGDDSYTISGGQGVALTNSVAIFIDGAGNDTYMTSERDLGQGGVRAARDFGNVGVFVDMEGNDHYPHPFVERDSALWFKPYWGVGTDVAYDSVSPEEAPVEVHLTAQDTMRPVADIFKDAALWEVTENRVKVRTARKALIAKGIPAVEWVCQNKLATRDGLEMRAMIELLKEYPDAATPLLLQALRDTSVQERKNVAKLLGELKRKDAVPALLTCLGDDIYEKARNAILDALGDIGDSSATPAIIPYLRAQAERRRIAATVALGKMGDPRAILYLFERLDDPFFTVRSAALYALPKFGKEILPVLEAQFRTRDPSRLETLLLLVGDLARNWKMREGEMGILTTKRLQPLAGRYLEHPSPRVRSAALVATAPFLNRKAILQLDKEFENETDPVVLARWRSVRHEFLMP